MLVKSFLIIITVGTLFFYSVIVQAAEITVGYLVKGSTAEVFLIGDDGKLHWIPDENTFNSLGYQWSDVVLLNDEELTRYSFGKTLAVSDIETAFLAPAEVEARVREFFAAASVMIEIARCESGFRQHTADGTVLVGYGRYIGVFQIDKNIHGDYAKSLGMDIETLEGNLAYAKRLYEAQGTQPWPTCAVLASPLKSDLQLGDQGLEVKALQKILNKAGFIVAASGSGSPGQETDYFGSLTREAVQRFQCAKEIVCSSDEGTTGYGLVGPKTRAALNDYQ